MLTSNLSLALYNYIPQVISAVSLFVLVNYYDLNQIALFNKYIYLVIVVYPLIDLSFSELILSKRGKEVVGLAKLSIYIAIVPSFFFSLVVVNTDYFSIGLNSMIEFIITFAMFYFPHILNLARSVDFNRGKVRNTVDMQLIYSSLSLIGRLALNTSISLLTLFVVNIASYLISFFNSTISYILKAKIHDYTLKNKKSFIIYYTLSRIAVISYTFGFVSVLGYLYLDSNDFALFSISFSIVSALLSPILEFLISFSVSEFRNFTTIKQLKKMQLKMILIAGFIFIIGIVFFLYSSAFIPDHYQDLRFYSIIFWSFYCINLISSPIFRGINASLYSHKASFIFDFFGLAFLLLVLVIGLNLEIVVLLWIAIFFTVNMSKLYNSYLNFYRNFS